MARKTFFKTVAIGERETGLNSENTGTGGQGEGMDGRVPRGTRGVSQVREAGLGRVSGAGGSFHLLTWLLFSQYVVSSSLQRHGL